MGIDGIKLHKKTTTEKSSVIKLSPNKKTKSSTDY